MITRAKLAAHRTLLILGAAAILLGTSGVAAVTGWIPIPTRAALPGAQAQLAPAPEEGRARGSVSCAECAVVASKRKLAPAGAGSGGYEITVRMMDGSSRAFKDANSANWRPGQRLIFIDGAGSLAANRE